MRQIIINGISKTVAQWAAIQNVDRKVIYTRLASGWPEKEAVLRPLIYTRENETPRKCAMRLNEKFYEGKVCPKCGNNHRYTSTCACMHCAVYDTQMRRDKKKNAA